MAEHTTIRAACPHDCPDTCAMLVTVEDGVATGVRGDPDHPFTRGGLCMKVNKYQDRVYSDDRVLHRLRRVSVPAEHICTLAQEYAANQPSAIRIGVAIERHAGSGQPYARSPVYQRLSAHGDIPAVGCCR